MMKINLVISFLIIIILSCLLFLFAGCKAPLPKMSDYPNDLYNCYLADKCMVLNTYTESKQECLLHYQKCFRYKDDQHCKDDTKCYDRITVRY